MEEHGRKLLALVLTTLRETEEITRTTMARTLLEADLVHYEAWKRSLSGELYDRALVGPVPQGLEKVLEDGEAGEILQAGRGQDGALCYRPGTHFPLKLAEAQELLTPEELDSLTAALGLVHSLSPEELSRRGKGLAAWRLGTGPLSVAALACASEEELFALADRLWNAGGSREAR